ncbi:MAG: hypothetical protein OXG58_06835, partial [Gemmatimonadetes bacterium]|nr:hypothetical protein [Gemmatimonadota bacterium]MCY3943838.1 hypothetical protein [Gemmatimonadota bacterium]
DGEEAAGGSSAGVDLRGTPATGRIVVIECALYLYEMLADRGHIGVGSSRPGSPLWAGSATDGVMGAVDLREGAGPSTPTGITTTPR